MTAAFDTDSLYQRACIHFDCSPRAVSMFQKPDRERAKRRQNVARTIIRFNAAMSSTNPPRTKQEAVEMVAPFLSLLLSFFVRQFAIQVIEWLWDQMEVES